MNYPGWPGPNKFPFSRPASNDAGTFFVLAIRQQPISVTICP